ncbi:MAG: signal peptide peptidase SppA [Mariprofundaceae bacterium]
MRRRRRKAPDFVSFLVEGDYPELPQSRPPFWQRRFTPIKPSLHELREQFQRIGEDGRIKGVVLHIRKLSMPRARLQTLRDLIGQLQAEGKLVVVWATHYDAASYYVACAADEVLLQQGGMIAPLGSSADFMFLADALKRFGVEANFLRISPYKSAMDMLARADMSEEMREMANWLMDDAHAQLLAAIGEGRGLDKRQARLLVDRSPYSDIVAREKGAVDAMISEEDLPGHLAAGGSPIRIAAWEEAAKCLPKMSPPSPGPHVAMIRIEGNIVDGRSRQPPGRLPLPIPFVSSSRAGDLSVVQQARQALKDERIAAVVVYVNTGGGSATASEAMAAALAKVAEAKPLVVAMGSVAASGGYYVATPAKWIVAQPGAITGSIGVLWGKMVGGGLLDNLGIRSEVLSRGKHAAMYRTDRAFTKAERSMVQEQLARIYEVFAGRVMASRGLEQKAMDAIGLGRVWTGRQARAHGLVDELGGLEKAIAKARELAGLDEHAPVMEVKAGKRWLLPAETPANALMFAVGGLRMFNDGRALCLCPLIHQGDEDA